MLLTILIIMVIVYAVFNALIESGFNPLNVIAVVSGSVRGAVKAVFHFLVGLSAWVIIFFVLKLLSWILLILSIDILTPPYFIDIESIAAIPLSAHLQDALSLSFGWALGLAYLIVFGTAAAYLLLWWFVLRRWLK